MLDALTREIKELEEILAQKVNTWESIYLQQ